MKDYSLLLNQTYLYVQSHKEEKLNYSKIAKEIGVTRQTVAKEFIQFDGSEDLDIQDFHEEIDNKYLRGLTILRDLDNREYTEQEYADMLGVSRATLSKNCLHIPRSAVYVCKYNGEVIYVGSTSDFLSRTEAHWSEINNHSQKSKLYEYLESKDLSRVEFQPIISGLKKEQYLELEKNLIKAFHPIGNTDFL